MRSLELKRDVYGGLTTFLTMSYIVVVNPSILATPGTGMTFSGVMTATVLLCISMTALMGVYAKLPYAVAPGLGVNAFFTFSVVLGKKVPWPTALGMVFWSGVLFLLCSVFGIRERILMAIPKHLRMALAAGLGMFLCFIGLKGMGMITGDPETLVKMNVFSTELFLSLMGLCLMIYLYHRRSPFTFILGIVSVTLVSMVLGKNSLPDHVFELPDFSSMFFKFDPIAALKLSLLPTVLALFFTDMFDSISTFVGVSQATGLMDEQGQPKRMKQGLIVDALASLFAGPFGSSSGTAYMESVAGIEAGAKTGRASMVTALCFVPLLFVSPLAGTIPEHATAPVLVLVGYLMFSAIKNISFQRIEEALPSFLTIILIPLTFSITQGILWGLIAHPVMYAMVGRKKELNTFSWYLFALSIGLTILDQI